MIVPLVMRHPGRANPMAASPSVDLPAPDSHDFAAPQRYIDALDDFMPAIVAIAIDDDILHLQQDFAFFSLAFNIHYWVLNLSDRWICAGTSRPRS
jgi:hypothetical protein